MRTEEKVMNNGKLQAKQETLKSLHCPSPQSSLFNFQGTSLNTQPNKESATRCPQQLFIDISTELLRRGQSVRFRAPGLSMHPAIKEGETITVVPISSFNIKHGDILLYLTGKKVIAHRVVRIEREKSDFATHSKALNPQLIFTLRGDASPTSDDPVEAQKVLGKVVSVERLGRKIDLYSRKARMFRLAYTWASRLKRSVLYPLRKWNQIFIFNKKHWGDFL
jgi:hypothetical protein